MSIAADNWLANVFGYPVFKVTAAGAIHESAVLAAAGQGRAFFYAKVPTTDIPSVKSLTAAGFAVVEVNLVFDREPEQPAPPRAETVPVREVLPAEHDAVMDIAASSFVYSRFHLDPFVSNETANAVKREWVRSYCEKKRGEQLLVALVGRRPAGFLAVLAAKVNDRPARVIDLLAVGRDFQGQGVGRALVNYFVNASVGRCERLRVGTQAANIPSVRLYERCGFRLAESLYVLHAHTAGGRVCR